MTYDDIFSLTSERNMNGIKPSLSIDEAQKYYGKDVCDLLAKIYEYCKKSNYTIYQHTTDVESANNIMKRGFIVSTDIIDEIPAGVLSTNPDDIEVDEDGVKTTFYDAGQCDVRFMGVEDELSDNQHFFQNTVCNLDFGMLTNPNVNRTSTGATLIFCVSNDFEGSREFKKIGVTDSYYDDFDDRLIPETYCERHVIPKQFCIGYLDAENKRFVSNPAFEFEYGIRDEFQLSYVTQHNEYIDLSNSLLSDSKKSK